MFLVVEFLLPALLAEEFLTNSATQLTYHGLSELSSTLEDGQICVLFRNNHFSTLFKFKVTILSKKTYNFIIYIYILYSIAFSCQCCLFTQDHLIDNSFICAIVCYANALDAHVFNFY